MKKIIIILVALVSCITVTNAKHLFEITSNLRCVRYISDSEIITSGENGTILKSIDGGENWKYVNSNTQSNLTDIDFLKSNSNYVIISGGNNLLLSQNKGETYTKLQLDTNQIITSSLIYNEQTLITGTYKGKLFISNNSGQIWKELSLGSKPINNIFVIGNEVFCQDDNSLFYKIDIMKQTFTKISKSPIALLNTNDTYFFDENIGVTTKGDIYRTINSGLNWEIVFNDSISNYRTRYNLFFALDFKNNKEGFAVGRYNTVFKTKDGGLTLELISNFTNFIVNMNFDIFENGDEDILYFTSDRFTVFKSTNSGITFQPTNLIIDSTFKRSLGASPIHFFDTNNCIYFSNQDFALFKSNNAGKSFINHIPLDTNDILNPYKYLLGFNNLFNFSIALPFNENTVYFYRSQLIEENGVQCKSTNYTYFTTDKGNTWDIKNISKSNFNVLNTRLKNDLVYAGGMFLDSAKSIEQGYLERYAGILKFNKVLDIVDEFKFPDYLFVRGVDFKDENIGYALLLDKDYHSNIFITTNAGKDWQKLYTPLDTMLFFSQIDIIDGKLVLTQLFDPFYNITQTKVIILDLITFEVEILLPNAQPLAIFYVEKITKNYIYFSGAHVNDEVLKTRKVFRLKREDLHTSIEDYNIEKSNVATVWLSNSSSNPFSSQSEFTATWLPNTDLSNVTVKVYDLNGNEVADLSNQLLRNQFNSNQSKIEFSPTNLPTGIYLPVISDGTFKKSISVVYVK